MIAARSELPAWKATRDTHLMPHGLFTKGSIVHRRKRPGWDWEPANASAAAQPGWHGIAGLGTVSKGDPEDARYGVIPYAGLEISGKTHDGTQTMRTRKPDLNPLSGSKGVPRLPCWKYTGEVQAFIWGAPRKPGSKIVSAEWPSLAELDVLEAANDEAEHVLAYLNEHRDEVARLPDPAWDIDRGCVNEIASDEPAPDVVDYAALDDAPEPGPRGHTPAMHAPQPRMRPPIYTKDKNHLKYTCPREGE